MNYGEGALSASDVALLTGNGGNNGGFGEGNGAWWIILFLIFAFGGFGRNGFGGGGYGGGGTSGGGIGENYILATDFATIERKLDSVNSGICDATFALNNTMTNGFSGVQQTLCQGFNGVNTAIYQNGFNTERGLWNVSSQIADCCCKTQNAIEGIGYKMLLNAKDIIENQNMNYRALHEELVANKLEMKNERIAEQQNEINALRLAASQERQNNFIAANQTAQTAELIRRLGADCPVNAVVVQPSTPVSFPTNCCGQFTGFNNNGCGCNNY